MTAPTPWPLRLAVASILVLASAAGATTTAKLVGYNDLVTRLGAGDVPTGAGVIAAQVEAVTGGTYGPNQASSEFTGDTFVAISGPPGVSGHATTVATIFYGNLSSFAPDVNTIYLYGATNWLLDGFLGVDPKSSNPPLTLPAAIKILNHSWVGAFSNPQLPGYDPTIDNDVLRRADYTVIRDDTIYVVGVNNDDPANPTDGPNRPLLSHMYNALSVGLRNGNHTIEDTLAAIDGPNRMKPEIVAPGSATSFSTPVVSAVAALLVETASLPTVAPNPNAKRSEVIKAVMLAGAKHESAHGAAWTNNPATSGPTRGITALPIDPVVGAGTVNVNISHLILTGGELDGGLTPATAPGAAQAGWDLATLGLTATQRNRYWRFSVTAPVSELTIAATWHRRFVTLFAGHLTANCDLQLWKLGPSSELLTLVGDAGLTSFAGGNIASQSLVDNVELLRITGLQPGQYALHLRRIDNNGLTDWPVAVAWYSNTPLFAPADLNHDGHVNGLDIGVLLANWSIPATAAGCLGALPCPSDLNGDGFVNGLDVGILLAAWTG